jgi:superfamily II DNA or RNA helicase
MALALPPMTTMPAWVPERVRAYEPVVVLRDYQAEAIHYISHAIGLRAKRRIVVVMATGGGKTVVFGALTNTWLREGMGRVLVLAHRDELISQAVAKMALWVPRHFIGIVKAEQNTTNTPVVVASVQTLRIERRLEQVGQFGLIVVDEAHHAAAESYKTILSGLGAFEDGGPAVIGVTATPKRGDGAGIDDVFEEIVYRKTYTDLVARGWLVPPTGIAFDLIAREKPQLGIDKDYAEGWLGRMMLRANAPGKILEAWQEHAEDRPTIVFTPTVSVAKAVAEAFNGAEIPSAWVSGQMPLTERRAALEGLRTGSIKVVANCAVLTEGFDEPKVACIVVARPTMNESLYIQMVGRGTRCIGLDIQESRAAGKHDVLIMDMVGCSDQLQLDAVMELVGRKVAPSSSTPSADVPATRRTVDVPFESEDGVLVARTFKTHRAICRWVELPAAWYALSLLSDGWVTVEPDGNGTWSVNHWPRRGQKTIEYTDLAVDLAKSVGEAVAREKSSRAGLPMFQRAGWLDRPISEKSLAYGLRMGLPITAETTAWEKTVLEAERNYRTRWRV